MNTGSMQRATTKVTVLFNWKGSTSTSTRHMVSVNYYYHHHFVTIPYCSSNSVCVTPTCFFQEESMCPGPFSLTWSLGRWTASEEAG